jgi:hypothetical protein
MFIVIVAIKANHDLFATRGPANARQRQVDHTILLYTHEKSLLLSNMAGTQAFTKDDRFILIMFYNIN